MDTNERLHFQFSLSCIGEGNDNPLQCSCLENPRDRRAWWAAIYGVTQSRAWLKRLSSSSMKNWHDFSFIIWENSPVKLSGFTCGGGGGLLWSSFGKKLNYSQVLLILSLCYSNFYFLPESISVICVFLEFSFPFYLNFLICDMVFPYNYMYPSNIVSLFLLLLFFLSFLFLFFYY